LVVGLFMRIVRDVVATATAADIHKECGEGFRTEK
jgi:hypothetical protein